MAKPILFIQKETLVLTISHVTVLQIIMTLITYQKVFDLTHNDLHTNNIMYNKTDKKYLYYQTKQKMAL